MRALKMDIRFEVSWSCNQGIVVYGKYIDSKKPRHDIVHKENRYSGEKDDLDKNTFDTENNVLKISGKKKKRNFLILLKNSKI